nr:unnamed protein product [Spirometra erinaceieuropaei]
MRGFSISVHPKSFPFAETNQQPQHLHCLQQQVSLYARCCQFLLDNDHREERPHKLRPATSVAGSRSATGCQTRSQGGVLFSLGLPENGLIPPKLLKEVAQFDDILLASYTDTYHNLTLKTISNLRFVHHHCLHASPSFVFLDDDHGINLQQLRQFFSNLSLVEVRRSVFGFINYNKPVIRDADDKWFTSISDYPFPHYPDYPIGPCYIIGADIIKKLSIASAFTRLMPNEDVYVGMMLMKLGVRIQPLPNMRIHRSHFPRNFSPLVAGLQFFTKELDIS